MKVLVTGGTGFIGPFIVRALIRDGHDVRVLVRDPARASDQRAWGVELVQGDMTDAASLRRAVAGVETVVHLVAIIQGSEREFEQLMTQGTRDLVAAAKGAGVRKFVLMSAIGATPDPKSVPYFRAKWNMEQTVQESGMTYVILRPSFVFGRDRGALLMFKQIAQLPVTPIIGHGRQRIQPIWVDDVAEYFTAAVGRDDVDDRSFEIGGPDVLDWNRLWDEIKRVLGKRRPSLHLPFGLMRVNAAVMNALPGPTPITPDQVKMLQSGDNVVSNDDAVQTFGIPLVPLEEQLRRGLASG